MSSGIMKIVVHKDYAFPATSVISFKYRKADDLAQDRALLVIESSDTHVFGMDLTRKDYRKFMRQGIVGEVTVWGELEQYTFGDQTIS